MALVSLSESIRTTSLPDQVRDFYDPNGCFAAQDSGDEALVRWMAEKRRQPVFVRGLGMVAGRQLVAAEMAHIGMLTPDTVNNHAWLELEPDVIERAVNAVQRDAQRTASVCLAAVRRVRTVCGLGRNVDDTTMTSAVLAANAHNQQRRLNGAPFYYHPRSVALLLRAAWLQYRDNTQSEILAGYQSRALLHDSFEDVITRDGTTFLQSHANLLVSPAVVRETWRVLGHTTAEAEAAGEDLLALSKKRGPDGGDDYGRYIGRISDRQGLMPVKLADIHHNKKIEPKVMPLTDVRKAHKVRAKNQKYGEATAFMIGLTSGSNEGFAAGVLNLTRRDIQAAEQESGWGTVEPETMVTALRACS